MVGLGLVRLVGKAAVEVVEQNVARDGAALLGGNRAVYIERGHRPLVLLRLRNKLADAGEKVRLDRRALLLGGDVPRVDREVAVDAQRAARRPVEIWCLLAHPREEALLPLLDGPRRRYLRQRRARRARPVPLAPIAFGLGDIREHPRAARLERGDGLLSHPGHEAERLDEVAGCVIAQAVLRVERAQQEPLHLRERKAQRVPQRKRFVAREEEVLPLPRAADECAAARSLRLRLTGGDVHEQALIVLQFPLGQILRVLRGDVRKRQRLPLERGGEARLAAPGALTEDAHEREAAR